MQESPVYQSIIQRGKEQGITLGEARGEARGHYSRRAPNEY